MTKIVSIQVAVARVPLDRVTSFATRTVRARDYALVKVGSDDGHEGIGFCYVGSSGGPIAIAAVKELLAPVLMGQDPYRSEGLWQEMYRESILQGRAGTVMRGISILDNALWDLKARAAGLPLSKYLGCWSTGTVPAYASGGYYVDGKTPAHLGEEMRSYVDAGFKAVKMKVGRFSPREEEARVRAAREAIGDDIELMLDANNAWSDLPTALGYVRRFEDYEPYFIEEPFSPDDIDNHARLAHATRMLVATGEIEAGRWRFKEMMEKGAVHILQTDAAVCGGITEWRRIASAADAFGLTVCPHWFHDLHVHLVASAPNARYVEYFLDDQVLNFHRLVNRQLEFRDGQLVVPTAPGLGFEFDDDAVQRYALGDGWVDCR